VFSEHSSTACQIGSETKRLHFIMCICDERRRPDTSDELYDDTLFTISGSATELRQVKPSTDLSFPHCSQTCELHTVYTWFRAINNWTYFTLTAFVNSSYSACLMFAGRRLTNCISPSHDSTKQPNKIYQANCIQVHFACFLLNKLPFFPWYY